MQIMWHVCDARSSIKHDRDAANMVITRSNDRLTSSYGLHTCKVGQTVLHRSVAEADLGTSLRSRRDTQHCVFRSEVDAGTVRRSSEPLFQLEESIPDSTIPQKHYICPRQGRFKSSIVAMLYTVALIGPPSHLGLASVLFGGKHGRFTNKAICCQQLHPRADSTPTLSGSSPLMQGSLGNVLSSSRDHGTHRCCPRALIGFHFRAEPTAIAFDLHFIVITLRSFLSACARS